LFVNPFSLIKPIKFVSDLQQVGGLNDLLLDVFSFYLNWHEEFEDTKGVITTRYIGQTT